MAPADAPDIPWISVYNFLSIGFEFILFFYFIYIDIFYMYNLIFFIFLIFEKKKSKYVFLYAK
jgi:hypothetical protein